MTEQRAMSILERHALGSPCSSRSGTGPQLSRQVRVDEEARDGRLAQRRRPRSGRPPSTATCPRRLPPPDRALLEGAPRVHENAEGADSRLSATTANGHGYAESRINRPPPDLNGKRRVDGRLLQGARSKSACKWGGRAKVLPTRGTHLSSPAAQGLAKAREYARVPLSPERGTRRGGGLTTALATVRVGDRTADCDWARSARTTSWA